MVKVRKMLAILAVASVSILMLANSVLAWGGGGGP